MNTKRFILATIAAFLFVGAYEFVLHGQLLKGIYQETAHLWRAEGEYKMAFILISQLSFAAMMIFIFTRDYENKGIPEGLRFGLYIGLLLASIEIGTYSYMPVELSLALAWTAGMLIKCLGVGVIASLVYKK